MSRLPHGVALGAILCSFALVAPATAAASETTVYKVDSVLQVVADAPLDLSTNSEIPVDNNIYIYLNGLNWEIADFAQGVLPAAGTGCTTGIHSDVRCPAAGITEIDIEAHAGSDTVYANGLQGGGGDPGTLSLFRVDLGQGDDSLNLSAYGSDTPGAVIGGDGVDTITASFGADQIYAGPGNDAVTAYGGSDVVQGDAGADNLQGGYGVDNLVGGSGEDTILGGDGEDKLAGGDRIDHLSGGGGADELIGGKGRDFLRGNAGDDLLRAHDGLRDQLISCGRGGADVAHIDSIDPAPVSC